MIDFAIESGLNATWDKLRITALIDAIVSRELPRVREYRLALHLVSDVTMRGLNARHRDVDRTTDVLSFGLYAADFIVPTDEPVDLGDVVVSYPRALAQAAEYGHSLERELAYLVAHGILHLLGYDHEEESERLRMRQKEEEALQPLGFTR